MLSQKKRLTRLKVIKTIFKYLPNLERERRWLIRGGYGNMVDDVPTKEFLEYLFDKYNYVIFKSKRQNWKKKNIKPK